MPLVEYDSSSDSDPDPDQEHEDRQIISNGRTKPKDQKRSESDEMIVRPMKRQRTLPSLPDTFETAPKDDPSLHQGRRRTRPYVDGEYNTHVYLSLSIPTGLRMILEEVLKAIQDELPTHTMHSLLSSLHISLTHPLPLRRHQIIPFRNALTDRLRTGDKFRLSFASEIKVYYNRLEGGEEGSGGRAFVALRVGAGAKELESILDKVIHPLLEVNHFPKYHENPEFHTSFGWTLLQPTSGECDGTIAGDVDDYDTPNLPTTPRDSSTTEFKSKFTPFLDDLVKRINTKFEDAILERQPKGGWEVDTVQFRVAKEVHILPLGKR
ncbi:hypothetical protein I302_102021 [Kwoniella bestiolae CBS 10118]|uniref:U6 snRNA phosphodiesterase 1 n=1 Tax=Kwoniella bestiolae CBS 10118 TaxID=1296100 RepID=A0A1B9GDW8_9TREE|nr:hypothetical protein I302_00705 [Kwoniella bestiolae CBS 10118]OCF29209.1 hypothetical protein I302_00705 [Kwoniella bestiolae CBS 10118]